MAALAEGRIRAGAAHAFAFFPPLFYTFAIVRETEAKMIRRKKIVMAAALVLACSAAFGSDRSDAEDLMNKCDKSSRIAEIAIRNFGSKDEITAFEAALAAVKQGKVKLAQSKFLEAKGKFEEYVKVEFELYGKLASRYIDRTQAMIDATAETLVDFVNRPEVLKNFTDAAENLNTARVNVTTKAYTSVIQSCRAAKKLILANFALAKIELPKEYARDAEDNGGKIYTE